MAGVDHARGASADGSFERCAVGFSRAGTANGRRHHEDRIGALKSVTEGVWFGEVAGPDPHSPRSQASSLVDVANADSDRVGGYAFE